jgi:hypothetical protein
MQIAPPPGPGTLVIDVPSDTFTTQYAVSQQNIGNNNRQCIETGKNFDCLIVIADVATLGNALRISTPICFGEGCTVGAPPPAVVNPGLAPGTAPLTGPGAEGAAGAASPAPAVQAEPSFTG